MTTPATDTPYAFHVMAKPAGPICNLDCDYCFFLSKELLYPGSRFRMADELLSEYVQQLLEAQTHVPEVVFAWQGGEPTIMGLDFFRRVVELQRLHARPGQRVLNAIQTNGTLLDERWCRFLAENEFLVGISIDGPRQLHDAYRVDKGGKPTFDRVIDGLEQLKAHGVAWNVLTTVNVANATHGRRVYRFLRDNLGAEFVQFIPIVERVVAGAAGDAGTNGHGRTRAPRPLYTQDGTSVSERSVGAESFGRFLIDVFEEWVRRDIGRVYVQMFDVALAHWAGERGGLCVHEPTCGLQVALEHNGDVYSCDHFVEPRFRLGNLRETHLLKLVGSPDQRRFGREKLDGLTRYCLDCDVRFACNGGCPKDRFVRSPYGEDGHQYLCPSYQAFFRHIDAPMRRMARLLADGGAPAQLMAAYAAKDARRGRNEPCTCQSGSKWKHCHGATSS